MPVWGGFTPTVWVLCLGVPSLFAMRMAIVLGLAANQADQNSHTIAASSGCEERVLAVKVDPPPRLWWGGHILSHSNPFGNPAGPNHENTCKVPRTRHPKPETHNTKIALRGAKNVPQGSKMEPKGTKMEPLRVPGGGFWNFWTPWAALEALGTLGHPWPLGAPLGLGVLWGLHVSVVVRLTLTHGVAPTSPMNAPFTHPDQSATLASPSQPIRPASQPGPI